MKVRTTYLIAAIKHAAYFVMLVVFQLFLGAKQSVPIYIHAALVGTELLLAWFAFKNWRTYREIPASPASRSAERSSSSSNRAGSRPRPAASQLTP